MSLDKIIGKGLAEFSWGNEHDEYIAVIGSQVFSILNEDKLMLWHQQLDYVKNFTKNILKKKEIVKTPKIVWSSFPELVLNRGVV